MRSPLPASVACVALLVAASASAQEQKPHRLEGDGLIGYTAVNADKWAQLGRPEELSHLAGGVVVRGLLFHIGAAHVGLELGTQRLFSYVVRRDTPAQIITETATVAGFHILAVARFVQMERYSWDAGFGWYSLGSVTVPGLMTSFNYVILRNARFAIPVGARFNVVFNEPAIAATGSATLGISIPLSRDTDASASR